MRRSILSVALITAVIAEVFLTAPPAIASDLSLFQRYFGTMDYSVTGTGKLQGSGKRDQVTGEYLASKSIPLDFPRSADLVGAFLYWQTHETTVKPSSARGYISYPSDAKSRVKILGKPVGRTDLFLPCWNTGGTGGSTQDKALLRMYRADVLRYLEDPKTGQIPTQITVRLSDGGGSGNGVGLVAGASLVLIYRHPSLSFKSIVIYDGTGTMDGVNALTLDIKGFDQASPGQKRITHGVGNGQTNFSEQLYFNNVLVETNPFQNGWDNRTFDVSDKNSSGQSYWGTFPAADSATPISLATTKVAPFGKADCLSWGFVVFSTTVQDSDEDGWLDDWELHGVTTPAGFVDLPGMGAKPLRKDLFAEIDYMFDDNPGSVHEHWPKSKALAMVGEAFKNAPVTNPDGSTGIHVLFDINVRLPDGTNPYQGNPYVIGTLNGGGDRINERSPSLYCGEALLAQQRNCPFPGQPGTISWTKGLQRIKNTYFNDARLGLFHYIVFGHQLALRGPETAAPYSGKTNSGRAELPGDTVTVTLGRWRSSGADTFVGSAELQAAVLLHEFSHNLYGYHGGVTLQPSDDHRLDKLVPLANCNNKQSSLNYKYLSAGLLDANGVFQVNLSGEVLEATTPGAEDEVGLLETLGLGPGRTPYRLRWYAPLKNVQGQFKKRTDGTAVPLVQASRYCDGTNKTPIQNSGMVRVDGLGAAGDPLARMPVDWDYDKVLENLLASKEYQPFLDINFNGRADTTQDVRGFNDWKSIIDLHGLQQVGSGRRRNLQGLSLGVHLEDLLRAQDSILAEDDLAEDDLAEDDLAEDDLGPGDVLAEDDLAEDDLAEDDLAEDDLGEVSEMDEALASAIGGNGPTAPFATVVSNQQRRVLLWWSAPAFGGQVSRYLVYRATDADLYEEIGTWTTAGTPTQQTPFVDANVRNGRTYRYVIFAEFAANPPEIPNPTLSTPSVTVTATP